MVALVGGQVPRRASGEVGWFVLGATAAIPVPGLPSVVGLPVVLAGLLALANFRWRGSKILNWLVVLGSFSLAAYVVAVKLNGYSPMQRSGVVLAAHLVGLVAYSVLARGNPYKLLAGLLGMSSSLIVATILKPSQLTSISFENLWKYGIAEPATLVVLYLIARRFSRARWVTPVVLVLLGVVSMFLNFRSEGLVCFVAAAVNAAMSLRLNGIGSRRRQLYFRAAILLMILVPLTQLPSLMESGVFGPTVQEKALSQSDGGPTLLAGRTEPAMSYVIISSKPLVGWGSTDNIPADLVAQGRDLLASLNVQNVDKAYADWYRNGSSVTLHSVLAQVWVEGGFFSTLFLLGILFAAILAVARGAGTYSGLVAYLCFQFCWDLFFSPYDDYTAVLWGMLAPFFALMARKSSTDKRLPSTEAHSKANRSLGHAVVDLGPASEPLTDFEDRRRR